MEISGYFFNPDILDSPLPLYLADYGRNAFQERIHRPAGIPNYQVLYTVSGEGKATVCGEERTIRAGEALLSPPFSPHEYRAAAEEWSTVWFTFNGPVVGRAFAFAPGICRVDPALMERIYGGVEAAAAVGDKHGVGVLLYDLCLSLLEAERAEERGGQRECGMDAAVRYISEHYREPIELSTLARAAGCSEGHFCRLFREYTHSRPMAYLQNLRMEVAKHLLTEEKEMTVAAVAAAVGYGNLSYFIKIFRAHTGRTPAAYRENPAL